MKRQLKELKSCRSNDPAAFSFCIFESNRVEREILCIEFAGRKNYNKCIGYITGYVTIGMNGIFLLRRND